SLTTSASHPPLHSFPTRRSSDLDLLARELIAVGDVLRGTNHLDVCVPREQRWIRRASCTGPHRVEHEHRPPRAERRLAFHQRPRSEEHTSELQSRENLVCRLLLE